MNTLKILAESLRLLYKQPKVFVPKLLTTFLYTVYAVLSIRLAAELYSTNTTGELNTLAIKLVLFTVFTFLLYFMDVISYAMYPKIVKDYRSGRSISLIDSLKNAMRVWKTLLLLAIILFSFMIVISLVFGILNALGIILDTPLLTALGLLSAIIIILAFAILFFFTVPIAVLEKKTAYESMRKSFKLGLENKNMLFKVNMLFLALVITTLWLVAKAELSGETNMPAICFFITVRLIQALLNTYLNVTNPYIYVTLHDHRSVQYTLSHEKMRY
ncbi:MAG: hypothetical protein ABIH11_02080 [Candidatus Altiarchaeota archaeon]